LVTQIEQFFLYKYLSYSTNYKLRLIGVIQLQVIALVVVTIKILIWNADLDFNFTFKRNEKYTSQRGMGGEGRSLLVPVPSLKSVILASPTKVKDNWRRNAFGAER